MNSSEPKKLNFDSFLESLSQSDCVNNEERIKEYEQQIEQLKASQKYEAYKKSGVPSKFYDTTLDSYITGNEEEVNNKAIVSNFVANPDRKVLLLCGNNGNGKTLLGCSVIRACGGVYVLSSNLCIEYDAATSYHSPRTREEIIRYFSQTKMLVIDECGKYTLNENLEKFLLAHLISARYENNLPTVLITNARKKEFIEFLGKSVFDRLTEVCTTLGFTKESKRKSLRQ